MKTFYFENEHAYFAGLISGGTDASTTQGTRKRFIVNNSNAEQLTANSPVHCSDSKIAIYAHSAGAGGQNLSMMSDEQVADRLERLYSQDKSKLKDLYLVACEAGLSVDGQPSFAQRVAAKLVDRGFSPDITIHAVANPTDRLTANVRVKSVHQAGIVGPAMQTEDRSLQAFISHDNGQEARHIAERLVPSVPAALFLSYLDAEHNSFTAHGPKQRATMAQVQTINYMKQTHTKLTQEIEETQRLIEAQFEAADKVLTTYQVKHAHSSDKKKTYVDLQKNIVTLRNSSYLTSYSKDKEKAARKDLTPIMGEIVRLEKEKAELETKLQRTDPSRTYGCQGERELLYLMGNDHDKAALQTRFTETQASKPYYDKRAELDALINAPPFSPVPTSDEYLKRFVAELSDQNKNPRSTLQEVNTLLTKVQAAKAKLESPQMQKMSEIIAKLETDKTLWIFDRGRPEKAAALRAAVNAVPVDQRDNLWAQPGIQSALAMQRGFSKNTAADQKDKQGHIKTTSSNYDAFRRMVEGSAEDKKQGETNVPTAPVRSR